MTTQNGLMSPGLHRRNGNARRTIAEDDGQNSENSNNHNEINGSSSSRPTAKRRRIALACNACRSRKSRCNGARPTCSLCATLGFECVYEANDSSTNIIVPKEYVMGMAERLQLLESRVSRHEELLQRPASSALSRPREECAPGCVQSQPSTGPDVQQTPISLVDAELQELPSEERLTDGMAISFLDEEDSVFFGPSSNISLMKHISRLVAQIIDTNGNRSPGRPEDGALLETQIINRTRPPSPNMVSSGSKQDRNSEPDCSPLALPSEAITRKLISDYFRNTGLLFPYIHEASFLAEYDQLVGNHFRKARRTWLGLLHMVLAMSSSTLVANIEEDREHRAAESVLFYRRAMTLCDRQTLRGTSLETVQYLLLMSQYLQGTQMSFQTWTIHGLAVKAALSLGLHSKDGSKGLPQLEQEIRKRAWYGCVVLDRNLSMTFGRPAAIPQHYIRLPLPTTILVPSDSENSHYQDISAKFYSSTITLYQSLYQAIAELYGHNLGCDPPLEEAEMLDRIFRLERALAQWEMELPPVLALVRPSDLPLQQPVDPIYERFRVILTLRKLNLEVLIHRPALLRTMESVTSSDHSVTISSFVSGMRQSAIGACVKSATAIISIIHHAVTSGGPKRHLLGAWWFSMYYVFNSALVLFSYHLTTVQCHENPAAQLGQDCNRLMSMAIEALDNLDGSNATIRRCRDHLLQLSRLLHNWAHQSLETSGALQPGPTQGEIFIPHVPGAELDTSSFGDDMTTFDPCLLQWDGLQLGQFGLPADLSMLLMPGNQLQ